MELEQDHYDVIVIGTGLSESIAAAALAKAGKSVLHLDPNEYYGGDQASLTLDELQEWCQARSSPTPLGVGSSDTSDNTSRASSSTASAYIQDQRRRCAFTTTSTLSDDLLSNKRRYALSLCPTILPSRGSLITTLINSGVSKYVSFRMLDSVSIYDEVTKGIKRVPGSKEQVFKDKEISLMEKRRLMKFLMFAVGEFEDDQILKGKEKEPFIWFLESSFSLSPIMATQAAFAIAHCASGEDETMEALQRTRRYLKSIGRYGSGAFLVGQYGGAGEIAQGFCRACAVFGGTYVLGPESILETIELARDAKHLISASGHLHPDLSQISASTSRRQTAYCIAILSKLPEALRRPRSIKQEDEDELEEEDGGEDDTAVIVFPPEDDGDGHVVRAFMMGEGTGSCPSGQYILYVSRDLGETTDPKSELQPYLHRLSTSILFESYYVSSTPVPAGLESPTTMDASPSGLVVVSPYRGLGTLTEGLDWEAEQGEKAFWAIMGSQEDAEDGKGFFDKTEADEGGDEVDEP